MQIVLKDFNRKFKTKFVTNEVIDTIKILNLTNNNNLNDLLIALVFLYFKQNGFKLTKEVNITSLDENIINFVTTSFKNSITYNGQDFVIWIKNKFKEGFNKDGEKVNVCDKSDICIGDKRLHRFYCIAENIRQKLSEKLMAGDVLITYDLPNDVTGNFLKKLLEYDKIEIHEIEFANINESDISELYIKAGSKKSKINKKVKAIITKVIKNIRPFNVKSILVGSKKTKPKERIRIALKQENFTNYRLEIQTKNPNIELKNEIETLLKKEKIEFSKSIRFTDEPIDEKVLMLVNKKRINGLSNYKQHIENWDTSKILKIDKNKISVKDDSVIECIKSLLGENYNFEELTFKKEGIKINGLLLKRKIDNSKIFFFVNHSNSTDSKRIQYLASDKRVPFFFVSTKRKKGDYKQEIMFTELNQKGKEYFNTIINDIIDNQQIYQTLRNNFDKSYDEIKSIKIKLGNIKSSKKKGELWERLCLGVLDYIFKETLPLSNSYLPDGITFFQEDESILWDSKGLRSTSLLKSTKNKKSNNVKDTYYIQAFKNKKFNFKYYAYITVGVQKNDFEKVKEKLIKELEKLNIKDVKIVCLTDKFLLLLSEVFKSQEDATRIHKNLNSFSEMIKKEFEKGFLDDLDKKIFDKIGKIEKIDEKGLRKEVKDISVPTSVK